MVSLLYFFAIPELLKQKHVPRPTMVQFVVNLNNQVLIVSVQDPVVVAKHKRSATLHRLLIPDLDLGLHGPLSHLRSQIHSRVNRLVVELLCLNLIIKRLQLIDAIKEVQYFDGLFQVLQVNIFSDDLQGDQRLHNHHMLDHSRLSDRLEELHQRVITRHQYARLRLVNRIQNFAQLKRNFKPT